MAKHYKIGQFVKVNNIKGLYKAVKTEANSCTECAFAELDCDHLFNCGQIPLMACLKRIK